jgi:hypothetical protein
MYFLGFRTSRRISRLLASSDDDTADFFLSKEAVVRAAEALMRIKEMAEKGRII